MNGFGIMEPTPTQYLTFQFVRGENLASDLIAYRSDGDFSHVDLVMDDGRLLGAHSDSVGGAPPGVQIRTPGYVPWSKQVTIAVPCTALQKAVALDFAQKQIGKPYDPEAIVAFVFARDWRDPNAWFCSELGTVIGETGGVWPKVYSPANRIDPNGLALICSAVTGRVITVLK